jgi:hypothetical protein
MSDATQVIETDELIAKAEEQLKQLAKNHSGIIVEAIVQPAADYKFWVNQNETEATFKPSSFYLSLILFGLSIFFCLALYIAIAVNTYISVIVMVILLLFGITNYNYYRKTYVVLNKDGINVNGTHFAWHNVLQCYTLEYPVQRGTNTELFVFLRTGEYSRFNVEYMEYQRVLHYIHYYMKTYKDVAATSAQPS